MNVRQLIEALSKMPQDAEVLASVGWSKDTATSDEGDDLTVSEKDGQVTVHGWMSNCGTELEYGSDEGDEDEG